MPGRVVELRREWRGPDRAHLLIGGLLGGFIASSLSLSLAGLVFAGPLRPGLGMAINGSLLGGAIIAIVSALRSQAPGTVAGVQDATAAIVAVAAGSVAANARAGAELPTAFAVVVATSLLLGVAFLAAGRFGLGRVLHYVPHPVILGFIAATGVVILVGAIDLLDPGRPGVVVPGVVLGILLFGSGVLVNSRYGLPTLLLAAAIGINVWSRFAANTDGWFLGPFASGAGIYPFDLAGVSNVDWVELVRQGGLIVTAVVIGVTAFMLNASAIATLTDDRATVDRDLPPVGGANVAAALVGGLPGFVLLSDTAAVAKVAGFKRSTGVLSGLFSLAVLAGGTSLFELVPTAMVGGVLVFIALGFFHEALWQSRSSITHLEYGLVAAMAAGALFVSFGATILLGLVGAVVLFAIRYAQFDVVRRTVDVVDYPGLVVRSAAEQKRLESHRGEATIVALHGFIFFATAQQISRVLTSSDAHHIVLDAGAVSDVDSSALIELRHALAHSPAEVSVAGSPRLATQLGATAHADLPSAVTALEDRMLGGETSSDDQADLVERLTPWMESRRVEAGEVIITQGAPAGGLFFVAAGAVMVNLDVKGESRAIRKLRTGAIIGEVSMYDPDAVAAAGVVAEANTELWHLRPEALRRLELEDPETAAALHRFVAQTLASRLKSSNATLRAVLGD